MIGIESAGDGDVEMIGRFTLHAEVLVRRPGPPRWSRPAGGGLTAPTAIPFYRP
ncbi:MAG: hypothetical protein OXG13_21235 [Gemmatimonadaceae bacterium]|nr:hypothetical protein [Gemmatimonadaceae bacterium]